MCFCFPGQVLKLGTLHLRSKPREKNDSTAIDIKEYFCGPSMNISPAYNLPSDFKLQDLYEHLEIELLCVEVWHFILFGIYVNLILQALIFPVIL